ncbi:MAG TPA: NAD(P)-dependent oxidoreductase [Burkholderiales bacterium]|nr:NAD(P)-dependent oxidoreductase [Burkholderiales bacterium]
MTVLVTGAGQIGGHIAQRLVAEGQKAVLFDVASPVGFLGTLAPPDGVTLCRGDIRDAVALLDVMRDQHADCVIHTAGLLPPSTEGQPRLTSEVNVDGTLNVLEAARLAGVQRVVFCSTVGVYDMNAVREDVVREDDALKVENLYAASKLYGEKLGQAYAKRYGIQFITLRFAHIFGPAPLPLRPGIASFLGELACACAENRPAKLKPRVYAPREYVYVGDAARAALLAAHATRIDGGVFNIGTGRLHDAEALIAIARRIAPSCELELEPPGPEGPGSAGRPFDLSRAARELDYSPAFEVETGMRHHVAYLRRHAPAAATREVIQ